VKNIYKKWRFDLMRTHRFLKNFFLTALVVVLALAACSPTDDLIDAVETLENIPPAAVQEVVTKLSQDIDVTIDEIEIVDFEQVEWKDACLDIPSEGPVCAQVVTPGFRVVLEANGQQYEFHSNEDGTLIVQASP
jgi:hypothetical protein